MLSYYKKIVLNIIKLKRMKKIGILLVALALVVLCGSCKFNQNCPAYSDNTVEIEQNV